VRLVTRPFCHIGLCCYVDHLAMQLCSESIPGSGKVSALIFAALLLHPRAALSDLIVVLAVHKPWVDIYIVFASIATCRHLAVMILVRSP
jgi:hypothetical protein